MQMDWNINSTSAYGRSGRASRKLERFKVRTVDVRGGVVEEPNK